MERYYDVEAEFLYAQSLLDKEQYAEAKEALLAILEEEPDYGRAHNHLGWFYFYQMTDYKRAEYHLRLALKFAPDYSPAYIHYGHLLIDLNEWEKLKQHAEAALNVLGFDKSMAYRFMALSAEMTGDIRSAMGYLRRARLETSSDNIMVQLKSDLKRLRQKTNAFHRLFLMF